MSAAKAWPANGPVDCVMVVGGGVAGIHAALDLAEAGYGVYLIEKSEGLGGLMPQLHRIYPLCNCCKLNNRVADCLQHPNIQVFTGAALETFSGDRGGFKAEITSRGEAHQLEVGAVIVAAGIEPFDPSIYDTYAYSNLANVVTSVEFEGLQKPDGPNRGVLRRPSDNKEPERIAWLQCVGSRDINACDAPYCSSVCCMYALKEAMNVKEHRPDTDTAVFFMDLRAHGKGFEEYYNRAWEMQVRLVRSRVHTVDPVPGSDDLNIRFADDRGEMHEETFDMAVLSVGLQPSRDSRALAEKLGITLNENRFVQTKPFEPVATSVPGIFVCGALAGPQEINLSLIQASAAAASSVSALKPPAFKAKSDYPPLKDLEGKVSQVGVVFYLCPASKERIGSLLDELASYAGGLAGVTAVERLDGGNGAAFEELSKRITEKGINRLVFASCSPVIHKKQVEEALRRAGLNRYLYDFIDLCGLGDEDGELTRLQDLVRTGVARAALLEPLPEREVKVNKSALVVGGGMAGLESALALASQGFPVTVVEKAGQLGGHARKVRATWQGNPVAAYLNQLIQRVGESDKINVLTGTEVASVKGFAGQFVSSLRQNGNTHEIEHGAAILAVGGGTIEPEEYLFGKHPRVFRWVDLNEKLETEPAAIEQAKCAVFIQCVGSREPQRTYCSRICCAYAVRTALDLKAKNPEMEIYVLYREMRTFGMIEELYKEAREKGIIFIRYSLENKPVVKETGDGDLEVTVMDHILGRPVTVSPDFISLQTAIESRASEKLASLFKLSLGADGFFAESPAKMKPVDSETEGVFLAGLALGPKSTEESIAEARAAAGRAMGLLSKDVLQVGGVVAEVDPDKCAVCCTCVRTCPFQVPYIDSSQGAAHIDPGLCQGCGMCVSECPGKAISLASYTDEQMLAKLGVLFARGQS
ncbi:MAG: FAD-dependent oxidoreductase [Syntrophobacteria bacterium]